MFSIDQQPEQPRKILVITNETAEGSVLHDFVQAVARGVDDEVLVVAPALNSRIKHLMSDVDGAMRAADIRLCHCVEQLRKRGVSATGIVGDANPRQALIDALADFNADEAIIATHPEGRSHWLERDLVYRARAEHPLLPIAHIVVDMQRRTEYVVELAAA